jgi:uncharacterized protein (TIGR03437 family)
MNEEVLLHKYRFFVFAAMLACLLCVQVGSAQSAANISIVSGSGQLFCNCVASAVVIPSYFVAKVTDASGRPVANANVVWQVTNAGLATVGLALGSVSNDPNSGLQTWTTTTDSNGLTQNLLVLPGGAFGTPTTPPQEMMVSAAVAGRSVTFTATQSFSALNGGAAVDVNRDALPVTVAPNNVLIATAGQQGYTFNGQASQTLSLSVLTVNGTPLAGVSVRIANIQNNPTAACITGPGADPGAVLTDVNGQATCTVVFNGTGPGSFMFVIGGVPDPSKSANLTFGDLLTYYFQVPPPISMQVTAAIPGAVTAISGSGQSANPGQPVPGILTAQVTTASGAALSGQSVTWSVNPSSFGNLTSTTTTTDANGNVSNSLVLSNNANGALTVVAALTSNPNLRATFNVTAVPNVVLQSLTKISGDAQSALVNTVFSSPLVVQVNSNTGVGVANIAVTFSATGGAILSQTQTTTGANGQALVTVTAPGAAGSFTVTASAAGFSQTFNLTATPPGPTLTAGSFVNAADGRAGSLSPCGLATVTGAGVAPGVPGIVTNNMFGLGPLSSTLLNESISVGGTPAPILNVATIAGLQQLTFQVPCTVSPGSTPITVAVAGASNTVSVNILPAAPGVFQTNSTLALSNGATYPLGVFVRPDGTFVTQSNAARKGETIVAYVTGLGPASPSVGTNALPLPTAISTANNTIILGVANAGVPVVSAQLSPDLVGVYLVSFQIPSTTPSGNQVFSVGVSVGGQNYYSAGAAIPVQ